MKNIMIKTAIASAVVAATTVTTIADVDVYGRLRVLAACSDSSAFNRANTTQAPATLNADGSITPADVLPGTGTTPVAAADECGLRDSSSRFGIKASSEISDGLTAFGKYEFAVNADTASLSPAAGAGGNQRLSFVGLKGGFGEISIGTRWSPYYNHTVSAVDPTDAFGGTYFDGSGYLTDFRNTDTLNYKNKVGIASFGVQVQINDAGGDDDNNVDEVSLGVSFPVGIVTVGLGYQNTTDVQSLAAIHGRATFGRLNIGGTYSSRDNDAVANSDGSDADAYAIAGIYSIGGGKDIKVTYGQTDISGSADPTALGIEYAHNLGAGFRWFAGFETADSDSTTAADIDYYGVGMRYDF